KELGYKCKRLSLETKKRGKWRDDLKTDPPCSFVHQNKEYVTESDVMVKATTESMALSVGGASWTIQKADPSKNRQADPLLDNPNANILMAAVLLMENGKSIEQQLADGDDLYAEVYFFY